jgi:hypothetical protein
MENNWEQTIRGKGFHDSTTLHPLALVRHDLATGWAVSEVELFVWDIASHIDTFFDPCALDSRSASGSQASAVTPIRQG